VVVEITQVAVTPPLEIAMHRLLAALVVTVALTGCATPTEPAALDARVKVRRDLMCIGQRSDGTIIVEEPSGGGCPDGFDLRPWT
jgi:hypothetical protein